MIAAALWGFPWGLPVLAAVGVAIAVASVWLLALAMHQDAWTTVGRLLAPPAALGRALLPLMLMLTVVSFFASKQLGVLLQVVSGAVLAALVWLLFRGQAQDMKWERQQVGELRQALSRSTPSPPSRTLLVPGVLGLLGAGAFLYVGFGSQLGTWWSTAGASGVFEYVALGLFALAASLRVFGYATNRWRIVTAVAVSLLAIRALTWAGVLRGEDRWDDAHVTARGASLLLVVVIVVVFAVECWTLGGAKAGPPGQTHQFGRAIGLLAAWSSATLLLVALTIAAIQQTGGADELGTIPPTAAPKILATPGGEDKDLAWTFAPVLHLQHDEDYPPISVGDFLAHATESGARSAGAPPGGPLSRATLPTECPDGGHQACGKLSCPTCADRKKETQPEGFVAQGVFYARVVRRSHEPAVFSGWNPWGESLAILIQYWLFYGYDRWQTETVIGRLTQEHQGDWEHVSMGLDDTDKPLFVALSAHCGGQVVGWDKIAAAPGRLVDGKVVVSADRPVLTDEVTHPIVAVAKGSHANYAVAGGHRPPDWGSCKNLPSDALSALSYASNVRDLTEEGDHGWFAYPRDIAVVTKRTKPMSYPGAWGDGEMITFAHRPPTPTARGPLSPPLQRRSWDKPIRLYFCDSHWHGDEHGTKSECRLDDKSAAAPQAASPKG